MEDRVNSIFWSETEAEARANGMGPGTLGITVADIPSDGQEQITRVNADITFNGYDHRWTVNGQATDIESIALHEIGHFIGFDHPCEDENETECLSPEESVLSPSYPGGLFQDLGQDDVNAVKYIYKTDTEATCEGPYGLYEPCFDNCECISNLICSPANDTARCSQTCSSEQTSCPRNFVCVLSVPDATTGFTPGICVKKQIDSKLPPGAICEVGRECASGNCTVHPTINRSVCIRNCDASSVTSCENGQFCFDGTCLNKNNEQGIPCVNLEDKPGCQCGIAFHNNTKWVNLLFLLFILLPWRIRND